MSHSVNCDKAAAVFGELVEFYGEPQWRPHRTPIDELILTILSANTNDVNSGRAFAQLEETFGGDWDAVRTAPLDEIKQAIRTAGMYNQKAPRIIKALNTIKAERGDYDLSFLGEMPVGEAFDYLTALPGVGHKTASIVLLFCFNRGAFPVDTHIQRISQRLGLVHRRASTEKVKAMWEACLAPQTFYPLHLNLIQHGRQICQARTPKCDGCPLAACCDFNHRAGEWVESGD